MVDGIGGGWVGCGVSHNKSFELRNEPQLQGASSATLAFNRSRGQRHHQIDDLTSTESGEVTTWLYGIVCLVAQCLL